MAGMRMRPSADHRAPGIYQSFDSVAPPPLSIANTRNRRLRRHHPKRADERADAAHATGTSSSRCSAPSSDSYTADSVYGFFKNGGTDCWVVRVAHCAPNGELPAIDHAACAEHVQVDDWNKPSLKIRALNEGSWGNTIWFRCVHAPGAQGAADPRSRHRLRRGARLDDARLRGRLARADLRSRELRLRRDHRGRRQARQVGRRDAGQSPPSRGGADASRGDDVRAPRRACAIAARCSRACRCIRRRAATRRRVIAQRSRLMRLEDIETKSPVPHNMPEPLAMTRLSGGRDGTERSRRRTSSATTSARASAGGCLALAANEEVAI